MRFILPALVFVAALASPAAAAAYDVVVYGGTSGGITAAIQAARMGKTAVLIEPTEHLGGLTTGGLGATDIGNKRAIGGMSREFYARVWQHYNEPDHWQHESRQDYFTSGRGRTGPDETTMWTFEPKVATKIYDDMLAEAGDKVTVVFGQRLDRENGVKMDGTRIERIVMESGEAYEGKMFIDATYEGDLLAAAGVSYHVGREANEVYDETLNGVQVGHAIHHQFTHDVDPYIVPGDPSSGLLPGISAEGPGEEYSGDAKVQAYCFRMCTTDVPDNKRDWEKPENYDEQWFELLLRNFEAGDHRVPWHPVWMPNRKTDTNNNFAISTDFIGQNWDYPEADYATRQKIIQAHEDWQKGLMWTLAHHPRVPEKVRAEFQKLGLAKDEFVDNDNWPRQLYIREGRRMVSDYVMTQQNCQRLEVVDDSVGMGAYNMDSHNIQRYVNEDGFVRNEGDVQVRSRPYPISYRSIRPKADECTNLLVPVAVSSSHIAFGSLRMEPVFMVLGQSAATAAVQAIEEDKTVQEINYEKLKQRLEADGQVLDFEVTPEEIGGISKGKLEGIVVDDSEAELNGFTSGSTSTAPFVHHGYRHDANAAKGEMKARFTPDLPAAGRYEVRIAYPAYHNRAKNVQVTVRHANGQQTITLDQTKKASIDSLFEPIGTFRFEKGTSGWVEISNQGTTGHVIVDAVQWVEKEG